MFCCKGMNASQYALRYIFVCITSSHLSVCCINVTTIPKNPLKMENIKCYTSLKKGIPCGMKCQTESAFIFCILLSVAKKCNLAVFSGCGSQVCLPDILICNAEEYKDGCPNAMQE